MCPNYVKAETKTLGELNLSERWLHERIVDDPTILGLGDVTIITRERSQPTGGRLDFLMWDPEEEIRYEVEIMLGRLDESHIIRTIEYWDVERTRFPQLEHRAVIVAEDITNRFFNVISILNRAVPIIAIQLNALQIGDQFVLNFTKVLDVAELLLGEDEASAPTGADPAYWEKRANATSLGVVDKLVALLPTGKAPRVTYNKEHIALGMAGGRNFAWLHPRKNVSHCHINFRLGEERAQWVQQLEEAGMIAGPRGSNEMRMQITQREVAEHEALLQQLLARCEELARS